MSRPTTLKAFCEGEWSAFPNSLRIQIANEIKGLSKEYILGVNESEYVAHMVDRFILEPLVLNKDSESIAPPQVTKEPVPSDYGFRPYGGASSALRDVYVFRVTYCFTGSPILFQLRPSSGFLTTAQITVDSENS